MPLQARAAQASTLAAGKGFEQIDLVAVAKVLWSSHTIWSVSTHSVRDKNSKLAHHGLIFAQVQIEVSVAEHADIREEAPASRAALGMHMFAKPFCKCPGSP